MTFYITFYAPFALMSVLAPHRRAQPLLWLLAFLAFLIVVGLRHHVGMDWNNYQHMIRKITPLDFIDATQIIEPLYGILLWMSGRLAHGVYGANLIGALIFLGGLFRYARRTPSPWLALLVAIPMLVVVIGMSANRQAVAIGILLWLVAGWDQSSTIKRTFGILFAALFHTSALFFLIFLALSSNLSPAAKIVATVLPLLAILFVPQLQETYAYYDGTYIRKQTESVVSSGALFHTLLNGGPALLVLINSHLRKSLFPNRLHSNMALLSIALVPASLAISTPASRISMYLFPVSIYFFAALPGYFDGRSTRTFVRFLIAIFFLFILVIWLNYSNNGFAYLPYQNLLTTEPFFRELCC